MIEKGCDLKATDQFGNTIMHLINDANIIQLLIKKGGEVNKTNNDGVTPLHQAILKANVKSVKVLIDSGSNVNFIEGVGIRPGSNQNKHTCLMLAIRDYHKSKLAFKQIIELLLKKGADPEIKDYDGHSAMEYARDKNEPEIIDLLKKYEKQK